MQNQVIYNSTIDFELPKLDLLSLLLDSPICPAGDDTVFHVEAAFPQNRINKAQTKTLTKQIACILREQYGIGGRGPGKDVVVCICSGQILLPCVFFSVIAAGGIYSAASTGSTPQELSRQITQGHASLIITSVDCQAVAEKAAREAGLAPESIVIVDSTGGKQRLLDHDGKDLLPFNRTLDWEVITDKQVLQDRPVALVYSSGTTGEPKGVGISQWNLVSQAAIASYSFRDYVSRQQVNDPQFTFEYRSIAHLPTAHIGGMQAYLIQPPLHNGTVFWMQKFDFTQFIAFNQAFKITYMFSVPPIYHLIASSPAVTNQFQSLSHAVSGAAPLAPETADHATKKLGCEISQTWGLSEAAGSVTNGAWSDPDRSGSIQDLVPNIKVRIVDDLETDVPDGHVGEFLIRGPMVVQEYWKNPSATKEAFSRDGKWFKTGDIGRRKNGKFYLVDRKKVYRNLSYLKVLG
ncbi:hypothetical protein NW754_015172 [Fusarium falciforme]|nr:hypothetical protein NW754_015172 [Fusarium falciforme]